jgi:hypothetical protein
MGIKYFGGFLVCVGLRRLAQVCAGLIGLIFSMEQWGKLDFPGFLWIGVGWMSG